MPDEEWRKEDPDLDMRIDNALTQLRRTKDIDEFIDEMERNMTIAKTLYKTKQLSGYAVENYDEWYMDFLVKYINADGEIDDNAIHIPIRNGNEPRRAADIDLSESYNGSE